MRIITVTRSRSIGSRTRILRVVHKYGNAIFKDCKAKTIRNDYLSGVQQARIDIVRKYTEH